MRGVRGAGPAIDVDAVVARGRDPERLRVDAVVNCTGPGPLPSTSGNPLWTRLIADGLARDHPCGLGVDVDASCRLRGADGRVVDGLHAIGPPTLGTFGESTAVPFIARQVLDLVAGLATRPGELPAA